MHVGILGGGNISGTHARAAIAAGCTVAAVWGTNADKTSVIAREHGVPAYDDLDRFLDHRPMELVAIGSPSGVHADHIIAAAQRGLHVLVEKPVDISTARIDRALAEAERARVKLGVFFQDRLKPGLVRLKGWLDEGRAGRVMLVSARVKWYRPPDYYSASRWRGTHALDGGGALINQGIHTVDTLLWLCGTIDSVSAERAAVLHEIEVEDTIVATLSFENGALGTFEATTAAYPGYPRAIEITGTEGTFAVVGDEVIAADLRQPLEIGSVRATMTESSSSPVVSDVTAHQRIIEDFLDALQSGREPVCSGREGRRSVAVVEALYAAARDKATIAVAHRA